MQSRIRFGKGEGRGRGEGGGEIGVVERHELFAGSESRLGSLNTQRPGRVGSSMFRGRVGRERDFMRCESHNGDVTWECELHGPADEFHRLHRNDRGRSRTFFVPASEPAHVTQS